MEWGNVTADELICALREVEWASPPRPLTEFFARFTPPKTGAKWQSRLKCNLYYYRTNYFCLIVLCLLFAFYRNPGALLATFLSSISVLCLNDTFATSMSDRVTRTVRKVYPPLAAKLRAPTSQLGAPPGSRRTGTLYICGFSRPYVVLALATVSVLLVYSTGAIFTVTWALLGGIVGTVAHASLRSPNLKARLSSYREEFRAVWRGYSL